MTGIQVSISENDTRQNIEDGYHSISEVNGQTKVYSHGLNKKIYKSQQQKQKRNMRYVINDFNVC